jgi:hypothetical protein
MRWTSALAIYILFWTMSLFLVLPFGVRTAEEAGEQSAPGHAESAAQLQLRPHRPSRQSGRRIAHRRLRRQLCFRLDHGRGSGLGALTPRPR